MVLNSVEDMAGPVAGQPVLSAKPVRVCVLEKDDCRLGWTKRSVQSADGLLLAGALVANDGAFRQVRLINPDVVLFPLLLGGDDGWHFAKIIRKEVPQARVILIIRALPADFFFQAVQPPVHGVITEPFESVGLAQLISATSRTDGAVSVHLSSYTISIPAGSPPRPQPHRSLTPRERAVLALACEGLGDKAIAGILGMGESTVGDHFKGIFRSLDVHSRLAAGMRWLASCQVSWTAVTI